MKWEQSTSMGLNEVQNSSCCQLCDTRRKSEGSMAIIFWYYQDENANQNKIGSDNNFLKSFESVSYLLQKTPNKGISSEITCLLVLS